jgi:nitrate reductase NapE component
MEHPGIERLRAHLQRHNRRVLGLMAAMFLIAAVLWVGLYFVVWWMFLIAGTAAKAADFHPVAGPLMRGFAATGVLLCASAWIGRLMRPNEAARDHKNFGEHLMDVVLAVPRLTLAVVGTGGATARLSEPELEYAWEILRRMNEGERPVRVSELPVEIPDAVMRRKIVLALQLSGVIEIRASAGGAVLGFKNAEARRLAQERVRLRF